MFCCKTAEVAKEKQLGMRIRGMQSTQHGAEPPLKQLQVALNMSKSGEGTSAVSAVTTYPLEQAGFPPRQSQRKCQINAPAFQAAAVGGGKDGRVLSLVLAPSSCTEIAAQVATAELLLLFQGNKNTDAFTTSSSSGQPEGRRRPPPGPKRFRAAAASTHTPGRR